MGTVVQLKNQINNSYYKLKDSVDEKLVLVEEKIKSKLLSEVDLVQKMTEYHIDTGGKRLRALLTLGSAKLCGYTKGGRDINLAACVEMIHGATLMHDDVIDLGNIRRGKKTLNSIWGNHSSVLIGDYLLSRCFEMMVDDGNIEVLKLLSSTSSKIAQGEVLQLQHKGEVDMLEETYFKIITAKTAELFSAATKVGAILSNKEIKEKENELNEELDTEKRQYINTQNDIKNVQREIDLYDSGKCPTCRTDFNSSHFISIRQTLIEKKDRFSLILKEIDQNLKSINEKKQKLKQLSEKENA